MAIPIPDHFSFAPVFGNPRRTMEAWMPADLARAMWRDALEPLKNERFWSWLRRDAPTASVFEMTKQYTLDAMPVPVEAIYRAIIRWDLAPLRRALDKCPIRGE